MNIAIVGLGLIGGSIAKAIKYNTDNTVYGYDIDRGVLLKAKLLGAVDEELTSDILPTCDIVIWDFTLMIRLNLYALMRIR